MEFKLTNDEGSGQLAAVGEGLHDQSVEFVMKSRKRKIAKVGFALYTNEGN